MSRLPSLLTLALGLFWTASTVEAALFETMSCAKILRRYLHSEAVQVIDRESMRNVFNRIVTHYQYGEWIESRPSASEFIVGAGLVDRRRQYGGIARLGFYIDALENPERTGRVSVWTEDHDGFESVESGSAGAIENLLRKWRLYCNQAESNLVDLLFVSRVASIATMAVLVANETTMGFGRAFFQYGSVGYLWDWALRLVVAPRVSYDGLDARARQLNHAFGVTRDAFSKPAFGNTTWAHFGVNLADHRKLDLIILRNPEGGPAFQTILLGFDGIK